MKVFFKYRGGIKVIELKDKHHYQIREKIDELKNKGYTPLTPEERTKYLHELEFVEIEKKLKILSNKGLHIQFAASKHSPDGYGNTGRYFQKYAHRHNIYLNWNYENQDIGICYFPPPGVMELKTKVKILFTMFESTRYPKEWEKYLRMADYLITPSKWCADIIWQQLKIPAHVIPLGYNEQFFKPLKRVRTGKEPYTFLHYDGFKVRKGWKTLLQAFIDEFGYNNPDVKLIFKCLEDAPQPPLFMYKNIEVIRETYDHSQFEGLLRRSDCFVFPSLGEGFGIPPLEAMRSGLHTICSYHTGMKDFVRPILTTFYQTKAKYDRVGLRGVDPDGELGVQFVADKMQVRAAMREAYEKRLHGDYPEIADLTMRNSLYKLSAFLKQVKKAHKL